MRLIKMWKGANPYLKWPIFGLIGAGLLTSNLTLLILGSTLLFVRGIAVFSDWMDNCVGRNRYGVLNDWNPQPIKIVKEDGIYFLKQRNGLLGLELYITSDYGYKLSFDTEDNAERTAQSLLNESYNPITLVLSSLVEWLGDVSKSLASFLKNEKNTEVVKVIEK